MRSLDTNSGKYFADDFAVNVGEPAVGAVVTKRQLFVVDAEEWRMVACKS
jgi:hypothetical protein